MSILQIRKQPQKGQSLPKVTEIPKEVQVYPGTGVGVSICLSNYKPAVFLDYGGLLGSICNLLPPNGVSCPQTEAPGWREDGATTKHCQGENRNQEMVFWGTKSILLDTEEEQGWAEATRTLKCLSSSWSQKNAGEIPGGPWRVGRPGGSCSPRGPGKGQLPRVRIAWFPDAGLSGPVQQEGIWGAWSSRVSAFNLGPQTPWPLPHARNYPGARGLSFKDPWSPSLLPPPGTGRGLGLAPWGWGDPSLRLPRLLTELNLKSQFHP